MFRKGCRLTVGQLWLTGLALLHMRPIPGAGLEGRLPSQLCCPHRGGQGWSAPNRTTELKTSALMGYRSISFTFHWPKKVEVAEPKFSEGREVSVYVAQTQKYGKGKEGVNNCKQIIQRNCNESLNLSEPYLVRRWNRNKNRLPVKNKWDIINVLSTVTDL